MIHETWKALNNDFEKSDVESIINAFIKTIITKIKNGYQIKIDGFGTFSPYVKNVYVKKSINTGNTNIIPAVKCISFKPSKKLK